jgi:hypothetical protein
MSSPRKKFFTQRRQAKARGIPFRMSFDEWWGLWLASGKWELRGRNGYCMCRTGDLGAYEIGNVFIAKASQNVSDAHRKHDLPIGVKRPMGRQGRLRNRFQAYRSFDGRRTFLGEFGCPTAAHLAYPKSEARGAE